MARELRAFMNSHKKCEFWLRIPRPMCGLRGGSIKRRTLCAYFGCVKHCIVFLQRCCKLVARSATRRFAKQNRMPQLVTRRLVQAAKLLVYQIARSAIWNGAAAWYDSSCCGAKKASQFDRYSLAQKLHLSGACTCTRLRVPSCVPRIQCSKLRLLHPRLTPRASAASGCTCCHKVPAAICSGGGLGCITNRLLHFE